MPTEEVFIKDLQDLTSQHTDAKYVSKPTSIVDNDQSKRVTKSRGCVCLAKISINYPHGYKHKAYKSLNVLKYGDMAVKMIWNKGHSYDVSTSGHEEYLPISEREEMAR
ncbi:hypothetical protein JCM33374_g3639 [Metschnikowia sp. JCM 33374]|nr:hypothetical protein JCM33374_g3639 [Metschnikowia sp. JCM 33374]